MELSIIIVNYNVKHFLELCLDSVEKARKTISSEVIVVDNNSADGSSELIKSKFKNVILIENKKNTGFSVANNQGIKIAKGKNILLLNPDTVIPEDCFEKCLTYLNSNNTYGALGIKMIDGKGEFLPESKRGLPTPLVAFYKIFGLSSLFKNSKKFGKYHLTYLDKNKNHEVDILSGAFMMLKREVINKIGYLDETFFMYGEDIDLSYRVLKAGYKNTYFSESKIIHFKGESTKKGSLNYVVVFYKAMIIFAKKHFVENASLFSVIINLAIYLRAVIAIINRTISTIFFPFIDFLLILVSSYIFQKKYSQITEIEFNESLVLNSLFSYSLIWAIIAYFNGSYDKPIALFKTIKSSFIGMISIVIIYSLIPEEWRFSRATILFTSFCSIIFPVLSIIVRFLANKRKVIFDKAPPKRRAFVGSESEQKSIKEFLKSIHIETNLFLPIAPNKIELINESFASDFNSLKESIQIFNINEVIFGVNSCNYQELINQMEINSNSKKHDFKFYLDDKKVIIGSNSIDAQGTYYSVINTGKLIQTHSLRNKRLVDLTLSFLILITSPILLIYNKLNFKFYKNIFSVLIGNKTWIGYNNTEKKVLLPKVKPSILELKNVSNTSLSFEQQNLEYLKNYSPIKDIIYIINNLDKICL